MSGLSARRIETVEEFDESSSRADIVAQLQALEDELRKPRELIESVFLDVGQDLERCAGQLNDITRTFETLSGNLASGEVVAATDRLANVAQTMQEMGGSLSAEGPTLDKLVRTVTATKRPIEQLTEIMETINIVTVSARIAASQVSGFGGDLSVFTADIARLATHASSTIANFGSTYEKLIRMLGEATATWKRFEKQHGKTLGAVATNLSRSLADIAEHRRQAAAASADTGVYARQIAERLGTAVFALQIGDITRQRVEHVEEALRSAAGAFDQAGPQGKGAALVGAICRLQLAQMDQVLTDFDRETSQIVEVLGQLASDTDRALERGRQTYGGRHGGKHGSKGGGESDSFLAALGGELQAACALMRDYEKACHELGTAAGAVTTGVEDMLGYVAVIGKIETDLRMVSLNMTLKCVRLGDGGRALTVIAEQLQELVTQTVAAAQDVKRQLGVASTEAGAMKGGVAATQSQKISQLEHEAEESLALLKSVDTGLTDALAIMAREGAGVLDGLRKAQAGIAVRDEIGDAFRDSIAGIGALSGAYVDGGDAGSKAIMAEATAHLGRRYTMASERELHDQFGGSSGAGDAKAGSAEAGEAAKGSDDGNLNDLFL